MEPIQGAPKTVLSVLIHVHLSGDVQQCVPLSVLP